MRVFQTYKTEIRKVKNVDNMFSFVALGFLLLFQNMNCLTAQVGKPVLKTI